MRRRAALQLVVCLLPMGSAASARPPERRTIVDDLVIEWGCPGPNPVEHATQTTKKTTFFLGEGLTRIVYHRHWEGWIRHRDTGKLIRDDAVWTDIEYRDHGELLRGVQVGAIWRFVIPGRGIVTHQSGRSIYVSDGEAWTTPFAEIPDLEDTLCRYV